MVFVSLFSFQLNMLNIYSSQTFIRYVQDLHHLPLKLALHLQGAKKTQMRTKNILSRDGNAAMK